MSGSGTMDDFIYKRLIVWQKAMILWKLVYVEVKKFPTEERYALSDQVSRMLTSMLKKFDALHCPTPTSHSH